MRILTKTLGGIAAILTFVGCAYTTTRQVSVSIAHDGTLAIAGERCLQRELTAKLTEIDSRHRRAGGVVAEARRCL